ncbi:glycosyltransferase [Phycicoccus sp. MAQZ13P-2]|uniref:glycosyltransferase family 2 protein n=1 Tax=Phycicoccus mangrovi TaxID=2840470 RepID=UPI001C0068EF|nr:glycosyltransferase family 2 protein [Phycicoccus mangrovi]MBT9255964.1 glycosyltransferase [Phycicoccus mangrovi]MBT9274558.1 glycosyltransferase [Phycicoccus mangrovi]
MTAYPRPTEAGPGLLPSAPGHLYAGVATTAAEAGAPGAWTAAHLVDAVDRAPDAMAQYATRTRSVVVREALARRATDGASGWADVLAGAPVHGEPTLRAALALALAAEPDGSGLRVAADLYDDLAHTVDVARLAPVHHLLALQTRYLAGPRTAVADLLPRWRRAPAVVRDGLALDLARPAAWDAGAPGSSEEERRWGAALGRMVFGHHPDVVVGVASDRTGVAPFDRLTAAGHRPASVSGELVTVIVPSWRPDAPGMRVAVRSILEQTWADLEVLVVDDASGPDFDDLYAEVGAMDERVRVVRMERNGGSYLGRNAAFRLARGTAITFQDSDDWSHPCRIADQVAALAESPTVGASRSDALRAREDLSHQWLGYRPVRANASSLMLRRSAVDALGDFLPIRRGADSEYAERITATGGAVVDTGTVLAVTRLRSGSLSRGDFSYQWTTPQRLAFKGLFRSWHRAAGADGLHVDAGEGLPLRVPTAFEVAAGRRRLDLVVMADLSLPVDDVVDGVVEPGRRVPPTDALTLDAARVAVRAEVVREALAAARDGRSVGVWHVEAPHRRGGRAEMHDSWFDLVTDGTLAAAVSPDEAVDVERLVVADPRLLAVGPTTTLALEPLRVELVEPDPPAAASDLLADLVASDVDPLVVDDALTVARRLFGAVTVVHRPVPVAATGR